MEKQNEIHKAVALTAVVRAFFKYFALGIIEDEKNMDNMDVYEPKNVKRTMLNHYEAVSAVFNTEAFYSIVRIFYAEDEVEQCLRDYMAGGQRTPMDMMRFACRTDKVYAVMVDEYKRCFEQLLLGTIPSLGDRYAFSLPLENIGSITEDAAGSIINAMAQSAYAEGKKLTK